jgi:hypothetical protein
MGWTDEADEAYFATYHSRERSMTSEEVPPSPPPLRGHIAMAADVFFTNLGLVLPIVLLAIFEGVVWGLIGGVLFFAYLTGLFGPGLPFASFFFFGGIWGFIGALITGFAAGIFLAILTSEARDAIIKKPYSLGGGWLQVRAKLQDVFPIAILLGVFSAFWSVVPFIGWLLEALTLGYFAFAFALVFTRNLEAYAALTQAMEWVERFANTDPIPILVVLVASILSLVPVLNILTLPYMVVLILLLGKDFRYFTRSQA